jgi:hypothetical protein
MERSRRYVVVCHEPGFSCRNGVLSSIDSGRARPLETTMISLRFSPRFISAVGVVLAASAFFATTPASAQYARCPDGYYYSSAYGCVPIAPAYNDIYGDPDADDDVGPPAYDTFGYGFGYGGGFGGGHGGRSHGGGGGGHSGGGGHGGGGHGGGGHGGGHH